MFNICVNLTEKELDRLMNLLTLDNLDLDLKRKIENGCILVDDDIMEN